MQTPEPVKPHPAPTGQIGRQLLAAAAALLLAGIAFVAWKAWPHRDDAPVYEDPLLTLDTPFLNVRPGVRYVGDENCAACHLDKADTYRGHPMGRALAPSAQAGPLERFDAKSHNPFEEEGFSFSVVRRDDKLVHKVTRRSPSGQTVSDFESEVAFTLGSGARGRSYLVNRDGFLFQSALSWYSQKGIWALSPGYSAFNHYERPINVQCLHCHCNEAVPVAHTVNRYKEPVFRGHAIGCERCHGPGELHSAARERGDLVQGVDTTIVNPKHLEPALREAVCQQCHLQGEARVVRRGREVFDYRPGLPFHLFWSVFVKRADQDGDRKAVGHVEQMAASRCFTESKGKLGCASCHDPHELPSPEKRIGYYRDRCLNCHAPGACSAAPELRKAKGDSCTDCHLQRFESTDIAHTAVTDHRVLRRPDQPFRPPMRPGRDGEHEYPVVNFYQELLTARDKRSADRDSGVALAHLAENFPAGDRMKVRFGEWALPLLDKAVKDVPDDITALHHRGYALWLVNRKQEALASLEATLARAPEREETLALAGSIASGLGKRDAALAYWKRAIAVNPWAAHYRLQLAKVYVEGREWKQAAAECEEAIRLDPARLEARKVLITSLLRGGSTEKARAEYEKLTSFFGPQDEPLLRRWFAEQAR